MVIRKVDVGVVRKMEIVSSVFKSKLKVYAHFRQETQDHSSSTDA